MGRVLASVVDDTSACHDTFCGTSNRRDNERRYGDGTAHGPTPSGRDRFVVALAKHGLTERDVAPNVNLFTGVFVEADGTLTLLQGRSPAGAQVVLRAEMPLIVTVVAVPHRLDPRPAYTAGPVRITAWRGDPRRARRPAAHGDPRGPAAPTRTPTRRCARSCRPRPVR